MPVPMSMPLTQTSDLLGFAEEAFNVLSTLSLALGECPRLDQALAHPGAEPFVLRQLRERAA